MFIMPWRRNPRGEIIYLRETTWDHIIVNHPELKGCLGDVLLTVEQPDSIYIYGNAYHCFRYGDRSGFHIMVIYGASYGKGHIKTAYWVPNPYIEVNRLTKVWPV